MAYVGYVTYLNNVRPHPNADRLQLGDCFGNTVCVGLDYSENDIGVYFPTDGQLSVEFCEYNNLVRKKDADGNNIGGYMDPDKRNVKTVKLRGEPSDGLFLPIDCLNYCYKDGIAANHLSEGDTISIVNGCPICTKYIPNHSNRSGHITNGNKTRKKSVPIAPLFAEHADTEQLAYNLAAFQPGDQIEITLKMHGTSGRTAHLPALKGYKRSIWDRIFKREGTPIYEYDYVTGTRRVVLDSYDGGFYGDNSFREPHAKVFEGKLPKGMTVYYEIVGFTDHGTPIMPIGDNKKVDKQFVKQYGEKTVFSYGCSPDGFGEIVIKNKDCTKYELPTLPISDMYIYRITMTGEDGEIIELSPDQMRWYCEHWNVKCVPAFYKGYIPGSVSNAGEWVMQMAEKFYDGVDPIGKTHIREGVVVRIVNKPKFCAYKLKNLNFKMLEGLIKENALAPDMEEEQEATANKIYIKEA